MDLSNLLPQRKLALPAPQELSTSDIKVLKGLFRPLPLATGAKNFYGFGTRGGFETPEFDLNRISQAIDSDSYAHQAFAKYQELFWKEGWTIVSENPEAKDYLLHRLDLMEMVMGKPLQEFLVEVSDQLFRYHNVFLSKVRKDIRPYFEGVIKRNDKDPVAGYGIIPTEQVEVVRDKYNNPLKYRQRVAETFLGGYFSGGNKTDPEWTPEQVIHLYRKRKPGRIFGTPFMISVLEDIVSLRQVEEDILNLVHRELFPFYKYKIGNDVHIPDREDLQDAQLELENLRTEGGLVMPGINDVDVVGGDSNALDAHPYLTHFKERVAIGLGIFPHHLGMTAASGNRAMTDRLDVMLYDKIKEYQRYFSEAVRIHVFNELLLEGGFDPLAHPGRKGISDRCEFRFNEIDVDTQIKKESHIQNLYSSGLLETAEARVELKRDPEMDEAETFTAVQTRLQPAQVVSTPDGSPKSVDSTPPAAQKPNAQPSSTGGRPNPRNHRKGAGNIIRPSNQHGTRTSPNVRRSDDDIGFWSEVAEMLREPDEDDMIWKDDLQ